MQQRGAKGTLVLLWDGSTSGDLTKLGPVGAADFLNVNRSLQSAMMFPKVADEEKWEHLSELRNKIELPYMVPECLHGKIVAVSSVGGDQQTSDRLKALRSGMWLRLRNIHIDHPAEEIACPIKESGMEAATSSPSSSSSSSSSCSSRTTALSLLSSSSSASNIINRVDWVGEIHADTHISLLLPYYR